MYGDSAGFVFLALWCFSPLLLAWGATICPDAVAAALGLVAVYTFRQWLHKPNWTRAAIAGVCLGLLPLTKLTWIIAFGLWPLIWCLWTVPIYLTKADKRSLPLPPFRQLAAILLAWPLHAQHGLLVRRNVSPAWQVCVHQPVVSRPRSTREPTDASRGKPFCRNVARCRFRFRSRQISSKASTRSGTTSSEGLPSYLRGQWADHGWWYYYLYALAIKEPLGTWCLVALAIGATIFGRGYSASWRDEMVVLVPVVAILVFVSSQTGFSVHSRYIIPALPFLFVWMSKVGRVFEMRPFTRKRLAMAAMVVLALAWSVGSSLSHLSAQSVVFQRIGRRVANARRCVVSEAYWQER